MFKFCAQKRTKFNISTGFTLIELVIVIVLLGVLFAIVVKPFIGDAQDKSSLEAIVTQIKSDIKYCRNQAIQTGLTHKIIFESSASYKLYSKNGLANSWLLLRNNENLPTGTEIDSVEFANNQIIFSAQGKPYEDLQTDLPEQSLDNPLGSDKNIILITNNGNTDNIKVIAETGYTDEE
jgi:prepilin-type N-terminal cleavage/methylation domain-containing protein